MQAVFTNHWKANTNVNAIQPGYDLFIKKVFLTLAICYPTFLDRFLILKDLGFKSYYSGIKY